MCVVTCPSFCLSVCLYTFQPACLSSHNCSHAPNYIQTYLKLFSFIHNHKSTVTWLTLKAEPEPERVDISRGDQLNLHLATPRQAASSRHSGQIVDSRLLTVRLVRGPATQQSRCVLVPLVVTGAAPHRQAAVTHRVVRDGVSQAGREIVENYLCMFRMDSKTTE